MPLHSSTIYVDTREKERAHPRDKSRVVGTDMLTLLREHRDRVTAEPKFLLAGDFCFAGNGSKGPCMIGIERKRLKDLLSSLRTERFVGEQLPKLVEQYEYVYLLVEGYYRTNWDTGLIEEKWGRDWSPVKVGESNFLGLELDSFLNSLSMSPIRVKSTRDARGSVEWLCTLHHSFSHPWEEHGKKLSGIHTPTEYATVGKASAVRRAAYAMTKIGWVKSGAVEGAFHSVADMCGCPEFTPDQIKALAKRYQALDGFGPTLSTRIAKELHGQFGE